MSRVIDIRSLSGSNRSIAIWLAITLAFVSFINSPEEFENALQYRYQSDANWSADASEPAGAIYNEDIGTLSDNARRKLIYFDEDYDIVWLSPLRFRLALAKIASDASTVKYRSFYSRGNISPRHILLSRYRDFVDLNIQQYGRSIH